jgi:hypothetical protein
MLVTMLTELSRLVFKTYLEIMSNITLRLQELIAKYTKRHISSCCLPVCDVASAPRLLNGSSYFDVRQFCLKLGGNSDIRYIAPYM